ncbi:MAG: T9SS type A sorting domain-containing protein [Bacteroidales bacterium]|nr:T9SS type A sorting domain-containing protein [Bacteroidales bacterium]
MKKTTNTFLRTFCFLLSAFALSAFCFLPLSVLAQQNIRDKFLVDKIERIEEPPGFHLTEYFYDEDNKLIKINYTSRFYQNSGWYDGKSIELFEYENNKVSKYTFRDLIYFIEFYDLYYYNSQGQLIREETRYTDGSLGTWSEFYYKNGIVDSIYCFDGFSIYPGYIFWHSIVPVYDENKNVVKAICTGPTTDLLGIPHPYETVVWEQFYEYDDKLKPNFGIDHLFAFDQFPGMGNVCIYERFLSHNNMTKIIQNGLEYYNYNYTYNEHGLPDTYQEFYLGYPKIPFKITYKKIEVGISSPTLSEQVFIYPNPTTGEFSVISCQFSVISIEVFDVFGRVQKPEVRSQKSEVELVMDISDLKAGLYFVKITTDAGVAVKKVVKE